MIVERQEFVVNPWNWRLAVTVAVLSGMFSVVVASMLVVSYVQVVKNDPIANPLLAEYRDQLAAAPEVDPILVENIRKLDMLGRKAYFTTRSQWRTGGRLLLASVVVFLVAFSLACWWKRGVPVLSEETASEQQWGFITKARENIALVGMGVLGLAVLIALFTETRIPNSILDDLGAEAAVKTPESQTPLQEAAKAEVAFPDWETLHKNWPSFRGPGGYGVATAKNVPTTWDGEAGTNVRWKVAVPKGGTNSPVVWGDKLFMSGADETSREVFCFSTDNGELLWQKEVGPFPGTPAETPEVDGETSYAAPTMVAHGDRVMAIFSNGDLVCYDAEGNQQWGLNVGVPDNHYGHASSLIALDNKVFVQLDHNESARLLAFDIASGDKAWTDQRKTISWASPAIIPTSLGMELILNCEETVDSYDPVTGKQLWSEECLGGEVAPSPAFGGGIVFVANEYATATAVQLGGTADAVQTDQIWEYDDMLPEVSSPVGDGERFYIPTTYGDFACLDAKSGEELWTQEFDEGFYSSPILAENRIYVLDVEGVMQIFEAASEFKAVGSPALGEETLATPAYLDGRIYIRGLENLYCIEEQDKQNG